jgi:SAM-dependent methyltransferase
MYSSDPRIEFFDQHAATWDTDGPSPAETLRRLGELEPLLALAPGQDVLEVGCGTGQVTAWLVERVRPGEVTAIDFSLAMLERARARGVQAEFRRRDVCCEDVGEAAYDVVFCMHSYPHFRDQAGAVRIMARALKPGGRLIILHLDGWELVNLFHQQVGGVIAGDLIPPPPVLRGAIEGAGLAVEELIARENLFYLAARKGS